MTTVRMSQWTPFRFSARLLHTRRATNEFVFSYQPNSLVMVLKRLAAILFLAAMILTPVGIVLLWPKAGTIWVAGYVVGISTAPFMFFGALGAVSSLLGGHRVLLGVVLVSLLIVTTSIASVICGLV